MDLSNHFLIAMPSQAEGFFAGSVVYLCEQNDEGAMGIVINKPSPIPMDVIFSGNGSRVPMRFLNDFVMIGGPVQPERGFVLNTPIGNWSSSLTVSNSTNAITTSRDIIENLDNIEKVEHAILTIGYSSWSQGQLEREITDNDWLIVEADNHILFEVPVAQRYQAALAKLGINPLNLMQGLARA